MSHWDNLWNKRKGNSQDINTETDPIYLILERVQPYIDNVFKYNILEFGCGQGLRTTIFARENGWTPFYLDSSPDAIELVEENYSFHFGNEKLPIIYQEDVFEYSGDKSKIVWSAGLNEHFFGEDRDRIFQAMADASNDLVLVIVPNSLNIPYRLTKFVREIIGNWPFGDEKPFTPGELRMRMENAGMEVIEMGGLGAILSPYRWFFLGTSWAPKLLRNPTPFSKLNKYLRKKDLSFNSFNAKFGREIYAIGRVNQIDRFD